MLPGVKKEVDTLVEITKNVITYSDWVSREVERTSKEAATAFSQVAQLDQMLADMGLSDEEPMPFRSGQHDQHSKVCFKLIEGPRN